jgi:hypothetical protein
MTDTPSHDSDASTLPPTEQPSLHEAAPVVPAASHDDFDGLTEEECEEEYRAFLRDIEEDEVLGPAWRHMQVSRGWR